MSPSKRAKLDERAGVAQDLAEAVRRYVNERENPAPDLTMRRIEYEAMKAKLEVYEKVSGTGTTR